MDETLLALYAALKFGSLVNAPLNSYPGWLV